MRRVDRAVRVLLVSAILIAGIPTGSAQAKSLRDTLIDMVPQTNLTITLDKDTPNETSFDVPGGNGAATAAADAVQRLAIRGIDFPVASTVPGFSYVYDPTLQAFTRSKQLGPVFSEKTETVGRGRFEVGGNYLYADLDRVDGHEFDSTVSLQGIVQNGGDQFLVFQAISFSSFRLTNHVINVYSTYGLTDRWDVNVLLPLMYTTLHVRGSVAYGLFNSTTNRLEDSTRATGIKADADAFGVGDMLVRTKYRLLDGDFSLAGALTFRLPTGNENNFQGLGDVTVTPTLIAAAPLGPISIHGTLGFEVNADDLDRTRARYTLGGAYQVLDNLAILLDVLGSSSFVPDHFTTRSVTIAPGIDLADDLNSEVPQSNVVDLATGLKLSMGEHALFYIGAIVPLTRDGLRAAVIPTGGIEVGF